jgi:DNA-binding transcriptional ArsR family regulator
MARQATFANFIRQERARLDKSRKETLAKKATVDKELESIERELTALDAYQQVKGAPGKRPRIAGTAAAKGASKRTGRRSPGRRGEKRQAVLDLVQQHPDGLTRGEILSKLGVKGSKSAEQSVSNALSALKKASKVTSREGKYVPGDTL